jgi:hypothetical protein
MKKNYILFSVICLIGQFTFSQSVSNLINSSVEKMPLPASQLASPVAYQSAVQVSDTTYDILYYVDKSHSDKTLMGLDSLKTGWTYTVASNGDEFAKLLNNNPFDLAILFAQSGPASSHPEAVEALSQFVTERGGSGMFATWTNSDKSILNMFRASMTGKTNLTKATIYEPLSLSLTENPISLSNQDWGIFSTGLTALDGGTVMGTFENGEAAIVSSFDGRMLVYGFLNDAMSLPYIYSGGIKTVRQEGTPKDLTICGFDEPGMFVSYNDSAKTYKWRISTDDGASFQDIADGGIYSGATNDTLSISSISEPMIGYLYQCICFWDTDMSDTSRSAIIKFEDVAPKWELKRLYTLISCNGVNAELNSLPAPYDNCGIDSIHHDSPYGVSITNPGGYYPMGTTIVRYFVKDVNNNTLSDSFSVVVSAENELPVWPYTTTENSVMSGDTIIFETCGTTTDITFPPAEDNCGIDSLHFTSVKGTSTTNPSGTYPLGLTKVDYYLKDQVGNIVEDSVWVKVINDVTPPTWLNDTLIVICGNSSDITFPAPVDKCGLDSIYNDSPYKVSDTDPSGEYPLGVTRIRYFVRDIYGNILSDSADIELIHDTNPPSWNIGNITLMACENTANLQLPDPVDECGIDSISHDSPYGVSTSDFSGDYPIGSTTVHYKVYDIYNNVLSGSITVTVKQDNIAPEISCPDNFNKEISSDETFYPINGEELDPKVNDECTVSLTNDFNASATLAGAELPVGTTTIKWTATDAAGNTSNCTVTATISKPSNINLAGKDEEISIYPNPSKGKFTVSTLYNANLVVLDISGKIVFEKQLTLGNNKVELVDQPKGVYQIKIISKNASISKRIIIE